MLEKGTPGSMINISSMSSHIINRRRPVGVYCASKAGVNGLTRAFAANGHLMEFGSMPLPLGIFKHP